MTKNNAYAAPHIIARNCEMLGMRPPDVAYAKPWMSATKAYDLSGNNHHLTTVSATAPASDVTPHGIGAGTVYASHSYYRSTTEFPSRFVGITQNFTMMVTVRSDDFAASNQQFSFALGSGRGAAIGLQAAAPQWGVVWIGRHYRASGGGWPNSAATDGEISTLLVTNRDGTTHFWRDGVKTGTTYATDPHSFDDTIMLCAGETGRWWSSSSLIEAYAWADAIPTNEQCEVLSREPCVLLQPRSSTDLIAATQGAAPPAGAAFPFHRYYAGAF